MQRAFNRLACMIWAGFSINSQLHTGEVVSLVAAYSITLDVLSTPIWCQRPGKFLESHTGRRKKWSSNVSDRWGWGERGSGGGNNRVDEFTSREQRQAGRPPFPQIFLYQCCYKKVLSTLGHGLSPLVILGTSLIDLSEAYLLVSSRTNEVGNQD